MKKLAIGLVGLLFMWIAAVPAAHADTSLQSSLINVNGTAFANDLSDTATGITITSTGFGSTGYGTVTVSFTASADGNYNIDGFFDVELGVPFYNEFATVNGSPASGQTYEIGDPNFSNIINDVFNDTAGSPTLTNTNGVPGTGSNFDNSCVDPASCNGDVSFAMAFDFSLSAGQTETVEFVIGATDPGGFNIEQIHPVDQGNSSEVDAFFSGTASVGTPPPPPPPGMPEPSTLVMLGSSVAGLLAFRRKLAF